ncbi:hypothetical protein NKJ40_14520 [Mesorhizobium sp. M0119]|uniref:hypothetical protein n=1 Tax=Mesorhizobium sp. M0119 TaxID=2956885 RepID=UPI0033394031
MFPEIDAIDAVFAQLAYSLHGGFVVGKEIATGGIIGRQKAAAPELSVNPFRRNAQSRSQLRDGKSSFDLGPAGALPRGHDATAKTDALDRAWGHFIDAPW